MGTLESGSVSKLCMFTSAPLLIPKVELTYSRPRLSKVEYQQ